MKTLIPTELLAMLENWIAGCFVYVKCFDRCSVVFTIWSGVRQGAVLSPILFAIYVLMNSGLDIRVWAERVVQLPVEVCQHSTAVKPAIRVQSWRHLLHGHQ